MSNVSQVLLGGREVEIRLRDGTAARVFVRELPIRLLQKFIELQDDEAALAELYTDQPSGWADSLTTESFEAVIAAGGELNFPLLERWLARKAAVVQRLQPSLARLGVSTNTLPTSAPGRA